MRLALLLSRAYGVRRRIDVARNGVTTIAGVSPWLGLVGLPVWLLLTYSGPAYVFSHGGVRVAGGMVMFPASRWRSIGTAAGAAGVGVLVLWLSTWLPWLPFVLLFSCGVGTCDLSGGMSRRKRAARKMTSAGVFIVPSARDRVVQWARQAGVSSPRVIEASSLVAMPGTGGFAFFRRVAEEYAADGWVVMIQAATPALAQRYATWAVPIYGGLLGVLPQGSTHD